jgi:hypothetical protein
MTRVLIILLLVMATTPAFARGHGAGSTIRMCSTCAHRVLCRFENLFSCDRSKPDAPNRVGSQSRPPSDGGMNRATTGSKPEYGH